MFDNTTPHQVHVLDWGSIKTSNEWQVTTELLGFFPIICI
jgi:hypothetical protein